MQALHRFRVSRVVLTGAMQSSGSNHNQDWPARGTRRMTMLVTTERLSRARAHAVHELETATTHPRHTRKISAVEAGPTPVGTAPYWTWNVSCMSDICHWSRYSHNTVSEMHAHVL